jgi:signal transduction histidine kinase
MIIESDTPKRISTDQRRLLQILTNLLSNAIKFTDVGSVTLRVARETKKDALRFSVEDTGCGIDPATSYALFEAFNRDERTADKPGSGLGLAIVKELSTLLGGSVQATGKLGAGSIFSVTIPTTHAREAAAKPPRKTRSVKRRPLDVLVAEDTYASMLLIRLMLEKRNCLATCVEDGEAAVAAARARDFDLILLDIQMPKANGFEAAAAIRALQRQGRRPFISALTAQVLEEDQARAHAVGMDHMLRKPFEDAELDDLLERAAEAADAHREKAQPASAPT